MVLLFTKRPNTNHEVLCLSYFLIAETQYPHLQFKVGKVYFDSQSIKFSVCSCLVPKQGGRAEEKENRAGQAEDSEESTQEEGERPSRPRPQSPTSSSPGFTTQHHTQLSTRQWANPLPHTHDPGSHIHNPAISQSIYAHMRLWGAYRYKP